MDISERRDYYMNLPYREILERDAEGGYIAYIPELKGCVTQGATKTEALEMLEEAKSAWIYAALEESIDVPEPTTAEKYSGKFMIRLPKTLHRNLAISAKAEGVSLNQMAMYLIASGLNKSIQKS